MADDLKTFIKEEGEKTRRYVDERAVETQRHFDVVAEEMKGEIRQVAEGTAMNTERLGRIGKQTEKIEPMQEDIEAIKATLDIMKNDLKQKVDRDEFVALERRVGTLEARFRAA